ncbi:MAG: hypothetical protein N2652_05755 [Kiritimatiellae bacterium]|nr:hypothetical protein [Kiritimatiellia bacterium]
MQRRWLRIAAMVTMLGGAARWAPVRAVEPIPDWVTPVFPALVPKSGHTNGIPANLARNFIEYAYQTRYENFWKEISYFDYNPSTGVKLRGAYGDTKTFGFVTMPWPLRSRPSRGPFVRGTGLPDAFNFETDEGRNPDGAVNLPSGEIGSPNRRYSQNAFNSLFYAFSYDAADTDEVWTPGEAFVDANNNGQWDPPQPGEDFWDSDHLVAFAGEPTAWNPRNTDGAWSQYGGELFADYNDNGSYNRILTIYVAVGGVQVAIGGHNELDLSPDPGTPGSNEGDFTHVIVTNTAIPMPYPINPYPIPGSLPDGTTIPPNGYLDATSDGAGTLQIVDTGLYIEYQAYCYSNAQAASRGYFLWADVVKSPGPPPANAYPTPQTVRARLFAARELYGTYKLATATPASGIRLYGDLRSPVVSQRPAYPIRRITNSEDGQPTDPVPGERFEDFLSIYDPARGAHAFVQCPPALLPNCSEERGNRLANGSINTRNRPISFTYTFYTNYLAWNYPGAWTALVARAFNGRYDGPDDWTDQGVSGKWVWDARATPVTATAPPTPGTVDASGRLLWTSAAPGGGWDPRSGYATWDDWYEQVFGQGVTPAPAFPGGIYQIQRYTPNSGRDTNTFWIPATSWGYDSPAEYCDMPSSIYHLFGDYTVGDTINWRVTSSADVFEFAATNAVAMVMGDGRLGEVTSPWNEAIWGHDIEGTANFYGPGDGFTPSAGPYAFLTIAGNGYDGANQMTIEFLTHRRDGVPGVDVHPRQFRDTNCDGYLDGGRELQGEANYLADTPDPGVHSWYRFMEHLIELWDQSEDFAQLMGRTSLGILYAYGIYPVSPGHEGWAALGGPSGQMIPFISRDTNAVLTMFFQVRPLNGAGENPQIRPDGVFDPTWDPNQAPAAQDFGMGLLSHEQGHDLMGWPDLYDYDTWSGGNPIVNWPIGSYDLMSSGAMVHGIPDLKMMAGIGGPWISPQNLASLLPLDGGPVTLDFFPVERYGDQYYFFGNPAKPAEGLWMWYTDNNTAYPVVGGRGIYIEHFDYSDFENAVPIQQKVNNHFTWEILQADGRTDLQDGLNLGDSGDPFPGSRNMRVFSEDTQPASRWWDQTPTGIRITNIELPPPGSTLPARVTFEYFSLGTTWGTGRGGADTDGDGIPDAWEFRYFQNLTAVNGTSDYDLDGLPDYGEYLGGTNPTIMDTDGDGVPDGSDDTDGDGISNRDEVVVYRTDPGNVDTDDDSLTDLYEITQVVFDPRDSTSPSFQRALRFFGTAGSYLELQREDPERRWQTGSLTVGAWISPLASMLGVGGTIYQRTWSHGVAQSLTLGLTPTARPYVLWNTGLGTIAVTSAVPVPLEPVAPNPLFVTNWTHVAASYDETTRLLGLWVNGSLAGTVFNSTASGLTNAANLVQRVGQGFIGLIDELAVWNSARPPALTGLSGSESTLAGYYKFDDFTFATRGADALWGTADDTAPRRGQVEDFRYRNEWTNHWRHAASLIGNVAFFTNRFLHIQVLGDDSEGDGMPDLWENRYSGVLDPLISDSHLDSDQDGWINEDEFLASVLTDGTYSNAPSPVSALSWPVPLIRSTAKSATLTNAAGQFVVALYTTNSMEGVPDGVVVIPAGSVPLTNPFTVQSQGYSAGRMKGGPNWAYAFRDFNNNETWDPGEPFGLAEGLPVGGTWAFDEFTFGLSVGRQGFHRFSWPAQGTTSDYRVIVRAANGAQVLDRFIRGRTFFHEGDFIAAGYSNGLSSVSTWQYFVYRATDDPFKVPAITSGAFNVTFGTANKLPAAPTPVTANGTVRRAAVDWLAFVTDTNAVRYELVVYSAGGTPVFSRLDLTPVADNDGVQRVRVPIYEDGVYTWQVRGWNAHGAGAWSAARTLHVNLAAGPGGPYDIAGEVFYQGKVLNPRIIVEAFGSRDFHGLPWARTVVQKVSVTNEGVAGRVEFRLRGLNAGTYYVRAYMDQNANGRLDAWESRGWIALSTTPYRAADLALPPSLGGRVLVLRDRDTDNDWLPDAWEWYLNGSLATMGRGALRGWTDTDADGLNDLEEYLESAVDSNPLLADTDGDGIPDGVEVMLHGTNPRLVDTDSDGVADGVELSIGSSPLLRDSDGDGVPDGLELARGASPLLADTDRDGYPDILEIAAGTNPNDRTSVPGSDQLIEISSLRRTGGSLEARARLARGISRLTEPIEIWMEAAPSLAGPWSPLSGSPAQKAATVNPADPTTVSAAGDDTGAKVRYYRLRWRLRN